MLSRYANAQTPAEQAEFAGLDAATAAALGAPPAGARYVPDGLALPDGRARGLAAYVALREEIQRFDAWKMGLGYEVPMYFFQGHQDLYTPTEEVAAFERDLTAPAKALAMIAGGGHSAVFLRQPFLEALRAHVLSGLGGA